MPSKLIYPRMLGYMFTVSLHVGHLVYLGMTQNIPNHPDPDVKRFADMRHRFFTCWNFGLQIIYALTGLLCDYLVLKNSQKKSYSLPERLEKFRDTLFSAVLWPSTWLVSSVFWPIFLYDRSLIFPIFVDQVLSKTSNHIIHSIIVPIVVWEVLFRPRKVPRSHKWNLVHLAIHMLIYTVVLLGVLCQFSTVFCTVFRRTILGILVTSLAFMSVNFARLFYSYIQDGMWLYPVFEELYGTAYFEIFLVFLLAFVFFHYFTQWPLTALIHKQDKNITNVKSKKRRE